MPVTYADAKQSYLHNADWAESGDVAKARSFATACRRLLAFPERVGTRLADTSYSPEQIQKQLQTVENWLADHGAAAEPAADPNRFPAVTRASFRKFRR